ncbi:MAG: protease complex subunit PrcB family protein [Firmicutes bacterium]|nr:protease complex subunit PrcB family protein [Bacillota bacterium]
MCKKIVLLSLFLALTVFISVGCSGNNTMPEPQVMKSNGGGSENGDVESEPPTVEEELAAWVENSKDIFLAQSRELDGKQYVLVTYGEKESDGYTVTLTGTERTDEFLQVNVHFAKPVAEQTVTDVKDYPFLLEEVEKTDLPIIFVATGAEKYVPHVEGVTYLQPIVAGSAEIKVFSPDPTKRVGKQFLVEGVANVHEGNYRYKLTDREGKVLVLGYNTAGMGDWEPFSIKLEIDEKVRVSEDVTLELFTDGAKDATVQDRVKINLQVQE